MWPRSPAVERERLEGDILRVRAEQIAAQLQLEDAVTSELRAMAMADGARAVQARCRRIITEDVAAICSLQDELAAIPVPRGGE